MELLERLQNSAIALWVAESDWGYPIVLTIHSIGMALVVGIVFITNIRALGYPRDVPVAALERFLPILWLGVAANVTSGTLLFAAAATRFITVRPFQIKILLLILGTVAAWLVDRALSESRLSGGARMSPRTRTYAAASMALWTGVIVAGRVIAYAD